MKWWQIGKRDADLDRNCDRIFNWKKKSSGNTALLQNRPAMPTLRAFGNPSVIREQTREVWSWDRLETLLRDLRISIRRLARQPGFSAVAMLVIAVGIGATISLFTVVWSVLLKPLPFDRPEQLVRLYESSVETSPGMCRFMISETISLRTASPAVTTARAQGWVGPLEIVERDSCTPKYSRSALFRSLIS